MPLPPDFLKQLPERTDADLYEMLANRDDYLPEALDAAREELGRRNLPPDRVAQLQAAIEAQKSQEDKKAEIGLPWYVKALIFIGLFPIIWFAIYYEYRGYKKKAKQCWVWAGFSFIFWFIVGMLGALVR
jgi:hypothetical protein